MKSLLAIALTGFAMTWSATPAQTQTTIQLGVLECDISAGFGLIFTEKQSLSCVYTPSNGGAPDRYSGSVEEFGLELEATSGGVLT